MYPKTRELVMATVKKVVPYGAFCSLDEYDGMEAFIHVSEIAPRWIKNVHEHVKEGQKIIARTVRVIPEKNQVDISIKRVTDADRVWKRETYKKSRRVKNFLEIAAKKLKQNNKEFVEELKEQLEKGYPTSYEALENLSYNTSEARKKLKDISKKNLDVLEEVAKENIKKQKVSINRNIHLESFESDGVEKIKKSFEGYKTKDKEVDVSIKYVGAPIYKINIFSWDYKAGEKEFDSIIKSIEKTMKNTKYNLEISENE